MSQCAACGQTFSCAMADPDSAHPCWCTQLPVLTTVPKPASASLPDDPNSRCFCPDCLRQKIAEARIPSPS